MSAKLSMRKYLRERSAMSSDRALIEKLVRALKISLPYLDDSDTPGGCDGKYYDCPHCEAIKEVRAALSETERSGG